MPVRLLLLALSIRWMAESSAYRFLTRQFWSSVASVITIAACVWLVLILNGWGENLTRRRLERRGIQGLVSILRLVRGHSICWRCLAALSCCFRASTST